MKCPRQGKKTSLNAAFNALCTPKKTNPTKHASQSVAIWSTIQKEVATPTAEMLVAKILFNRVISTRGAWFMTIDISNFYLMTPLKWLEYIRVKIYPRKSSTNTNKYTRKSTKWEWYTYRSQKACTDYHRQSSLQTNSSNNASTSRDTSRANWCPGCGNTSRDQYNSHLS